ncbi:DNA-3-methyladenine glycosylase 2 family protein [Pseudonocardia xishanensis]|uniref:DNA-3-methyladenine glycosylase n=1 Tax=Pseudonocardia xishanensis TaxID=630995 RepID=A0ABP8RS76_9PSEU
MTTEQTFTLRPLGPFSLLEAGAFGRAAEPAGDWPGGGTLDPADGTLRLAFCRDDLGGQVGVALRADEGGVHGTVSGLDPGDPVDPVRAQVARILSLDGDGAAFLEVGERDPLIGRIQAAAPGLRPVLFASPYEAAAWSVITQRWGRGQALRARERVSRELGRVLEVAGVEVPALPTPAQLLAAERIPGMPELKQERLRAVARAAQGGLLDATAIHEGDPAEVRARLRTVSGLGEFAASLIHLRASGVQDALVDGEPRLAALVGAGYGLGRPADAAELARIAEAWRPFRTWSAVLVRAAGRRLPELAAAPDPAPRVARPRTPVRPRPEPLALIS